MLPFRTVTTVFRRIYLFSLLLFITWLPRYEYPERRENEPGFNEVFLDSNDDFDTADFDLPSPNVAYAPAAEITSNSITASFLLTILIIVSLGWFIATKIKTNKNIKQTVYPEF